MERKVRFLPANDRTNPDPKKDYGVDCITILFQVIGELGVTEFELSTNWYLEHVMERRLQYMKKEIMLGKEDFLLKSWIRPYPLDTCYFSYKRISEDDAYWEDGAPKHVPDMVPCYYGYRYQEEEDGTWTNDYVYNKLLIGGDKELWDFLENYYVEVFGELR